MSPIADHLLFAAAWASFGILHTALAGPRAKALFTPLLGDFYRITYNLIAGIHLAAILYVEWRFFPGRLVFDYPDGVRWTLYVLQALGWIVVIAGLAQYDLGRFSGLTQARLVIHRRGAQRRLGGAEAETPPPDAAPAEIEPLATGGPLRWVRHPLYSGLFLVLWSRVFDEFTLASAVWGSLYLLIGARFEERKLVEIYGEAYRRYRNVVPAYIPWRGRAWTE